MRSLSSSAMATAMVLLGFAWPVAAADTAPVTMAPATGAERPIGADAGGQALPQPPGATALGTPLSRESLHSMRGGDSTTTNDVDLRGGVDGNSATNVVSGTNIIQDGSFANSSGISTVIQNSGSNVLIQNGTIVNVQFVDPGL